MNAPRRRYLALGILLFVVVFAAFLWLRPLLNIGSGYAAKHACSCHFIQGRSLDDVSRNDLNFSVLGWFSLRAEGDTLRSSLLGLVPRKAVYREGAGCTLLMEEAKLSDLTVPDLPTVSEKDFGVAAGRLSVALKDALEPVSGGGTRGIVVLQDGELVGEVYAPGYGPETRLLGWSMTKSLTALAVGHHLHRTGRSVEEVGNPFPRDWTDARAAVTLDDLLHMNSGLGWNESYGSISDATIMLHEQPGFAAYAMGMPLMAEPGTEWVYSSGTTNVVMEYLRRELGSNAALYDFLYDSLFHRIAPSLIIEPDMSGLPVGSSYGWATARDWARLGQFMLQGGVWEGTSYLPPGYINYLSAPARGSDGDYGAHVWLGEDYYAMRGFQDQRVFIFPEERLVIARLGHNDDKTFDFEVLTQRIRDELR